MGERGQTGVLVLLEGDWEQGVRRGLGGWQSNGWGRWQHSHAECNQQAPIGNPSFSTQASTCRFLLNPLQPPRIPLQRTAEGGWLTRSTAAPVKGHWYKPKMRRDITVACLLRLDLHCQMFCGGPTQGIYTSIYRQHAGSTASHRQMQFVSSAFIAIMHTYKSATLCTLCVAA